MILRPDAYCFKLHVSPRQAAKEIHWQRTDTFSRDDLNFFFQQINIIEWSFPRAPAQKDCASRPKRRRYGESNKTLTYYATSTLRHHLNPAIDSCSSESQGKGSFSALTHYATTPDNRLLQGLYAYRRLAVAECDHALSRLKVGLANLKTGTPYLKNQSQEQAVHGQQRWC